MKNTIQHIYIVHDDLNIIKVDVIRRTKSFYRFNYNEHEVIHDGGYCDFFESRIRKDAPNVDLSYESALKYAQEKQSELIKKKERELLSAKNLYPLNIKERS